MDIICEWCETGAVKVVSLDTGKRIPVCLHCASVFEFGQEDFEATVHYIGDLYLVKQENGTWAEVCRECGYIQDETTPLCQACGEEV